MPLLILQIKLWNFEGIQMRKYVRFPEYNQCSERFNSSLFKAVNFKNLLTESIYKWLKICRMPIINSKFLERKSSFEKLSLGNLQLCKLIAMKKPVSAYMLKCSQLKASFSTQFHSSPAFYLLSYLLYLRSLSDSFRPHGS